MQRARWWMMAAALGLTSACGGSGDDELMSEGMDDSGADAGAEEPEAELDPEQTQALLRIDVVLGEDAPRIVNVEPVQAAATPTPVLGPDFMLVAYAGDTLVTAQGVRAPVEAITEGEGADGTEWNDVTILSEARATVFVAADAGIDRLELIDESGDVLDARAGEDVPAADQGFRAAALPSPYGHIDMLEPGDELALPPELRERIVEIHVPTEEQVATIEAGLSRCAPRSLAAVRTIAIVDYAEGDTALATTYGSTVILRRSSLAKASFPATVVHEAAHSLHYLLDTRYTATAYDAWPGAVQTAAANTVQDYLLGDGFGVVWEQMHGTAVGAGLAMGYVGAGWRDLSNADAIPGGFAAAYGASVDGEDIATYVETVQAGDISHRGRGACVRFDGKSELGDSEAIAYTKLALLEGVGLVTKSKFDACVGSVKLDGPPGIHFGDLLSLPRDLDAGYTHYEGVDWFAVVGSESGGSYGAVLRVRSKQGGALGVHRLDPVDYFTIQSERNALLVDHENPAYARASGEGLVVVTEASSEGSRGLVLGLTLHNAFGEQTDYIPVTEFFVP